MKKSILLAFAIFFSCVIFAQNELLVQHDGKGLYLNHKVVAHENFYSIGRLFNISAKEIATYNSLDMNHGLMIGQVIRIPLSTSNFTQKAEKGRAVFYVVGPGEGLYRVSVKNNNVLMASLRKWNKLAKDDISTGQKLVVGYLVSPEADKIVSADIPEQQPIHTDVKPEVQKVEAEVKIKEEAKPKEETKYTEVQKADPPARPVNTIPQQTAVVDGNGGYFKQQYELQIKTQPARVNETASAGIFKTSSGWQDGKYYALIDKVEPGTIIRVVNPTNNKSVYVKVLGEVSGIRQNQGYDVRISNAAASALEVSDTDKFIVKVNY